MTKEIKPYKSNETKYEYTQCLLERNDVHQVAFIPSTYAVQGAYIKIKNNINVKPLQPDNWEDGWLVVEVYEKFNGVFITEIKHSLMNQRKVSDI